METESAVKDPDFECSLYSATCKKTVEGPSNMAARVEADAILAWVPWTAWVIKEPIKEYILLGPLCKNFKNVN